MDTPAVLVNFWSSDKPGDFAAMRATLPDSLVVRASAPETTVELAATCPQLQPYFPETACDDANPRSLPAEIRQTLGQALSHGYAPVTLVEADALDTESFLAVIGTGPYGTLIEEVRSAARRHLLWTAITDNDAKLKPPASAVWLVAGLRIAVATLALAAIVAAVDRFLGLQKHRSQLLHIGLLPRQLGQIDALQFLVVVLTAITLGAGLGVLTVTRFLANSPGTPVPWADMRGVIQLSLLGAFVGTVLVMLFEVRRFSREERRF